MNKKINCSECGEEMELVDEMPYDDDTEASSCALAPEGTSSTFDPSLLEDKRIMQTYRCPKCNHEADVFIGPF